MAVDLIRSYIPLVCFATVCGATDADVDRIVREVHAKRLVAVLGEVEAFKKYAFSLVESRAKMEPNVSAFYWSRLRYEFNTDEFEDAITSHYAEAFTANELTYMADLLSQPNLRGLIYWLRESWAIPEEAKPAEMERLRRWYGDKTFHALGGLVNSALGNQLRAVATSALDVRHQIAVSSLAAASARAQRALSK